MLASAQGTSSPLSQMNSVFVNGAIVVYVRGVCGLVCSVRRSPASELGHSIGPDEAGEPRHERIERKQTELGRRMRASTVRPPNRSPLPQTNCKRNEK